MKFLIFFLLVNLSCWAFPPSTNQEVRRWSKIQFETSLKQIFLNFEYAQKKGANSGAVIAAPGTARDYTSGFIQNYEFHWTRDGAIVVRSLINALPEVEDETLRSKIELFVKNYIEFTQKQQRDSDGRLGEPKFFLDGRVYDGGWGRPQNDGPPLRALTLMKWMRYKGSAVDSKALYHDVVLPDLQYTLNNMNSMGFDIWEEVYGDHFFVRLMQYSALLHGSELAKSVGDVANAIEFKKAADAWSERLREFTKFGKPYIGATKDGSGGHVNNKDSNLDVAVLLGVLYAQAFLDDSVFESKDFSILDPWVLSTAHHLRGAFQKTFGINQKGYLSTLFGRYQEDRYFGGNPWPIATLAYGELLYRLAEKLENLQSLEITPLNKGFFNDILKESGEPEVQDGMVLKSGERLAKLRVALQHSGNLILTRVRFHSGTNGEIYEQFNRETGELTALPHLTWSHAAMIETLIVRKRSERGLFRTNLVYPRCLSLLSRKFGT